MTFRHGHFHFTGKKSCLLFTLNLAIKDFVFSEVIQSTNNFTLSSLTSGHFLGFNGITP